MAAQIWGCVALVSIPLASETLQCCYRATHGLASSSPSCTRSVPVRQNALFDLALLQLYMHDLLLRLLDPTD
jgi:hypothetical protein